MHLPLASRSFARLVALACALPAAASCQSILWSCSDGIQNGAESGPDCGGGACAPCGFGISCRSDGDCASGACVDQRCAIGASCSDGIVSGDETDTDCGGGCPPCADGAHCLRASDCASVHCVQGRCATPSCTNHLTDGNESDVDCGGSCPGCPAGANCRAPADCASGSCASGLCQATRCHDGVKDDDESDVDCGGATCPLCPTGGACLAPTDCESSICEGGQCRPMPTTCGPGYMTGLQGCECDPQTCGSCCDEDNGRRCGLTFDINSNNCGTHGQSCFFCDAGKGENCEHVFQGKDYCALACDLAPCAGCCTGPQNQFRKYCRFGDDDAACGIGGVHCQACADDERCLANKCVKK